MFSVPMYYVISQFFYWNCSIDVTYGVSCILVFRTICCDTLYWKEQNSVISLRVRKYGERKEPYV